MPGDLSDGLILRGAILTNGTMLRLDAQLIQYETRRQIWAHRFLQSSSEIEVAKFLENTARQVALMLLSESGVLHRLQARHLGSASSTHPNTHEAILRYLDWIVSHRPENFERVVQSLQMAVEQDSRSGMARSFLARCYADLWALDFGGGPVRIEDALDLALEGLSRNPDDCRAEGAAGYVYLVMDRLDSARQHAEAALIKTGGSSLFLDVISWLLTLCGEWDRGSANLRKAIRENPFHSPFVHGALCFEAIRREDYTLALKEARATKSSSNFWGPLMRCVALVYLGRIDEAHRFRDEVLQIQPGFLERGDWLIRRYAKDNSVVERIKEGLAIAGLRVT